MRNFRYFQPTEIRFGRGRLSEIGDVVATYGRRCLLVTMPAFPSISPIYEKVKKHLKSSGIKLAHFDRVMANPTTDIVTEGAALARQHEADVILGLGGGSSMDTAKAIAVEAAHPGISWDYLFFRESQPTEKTLPIITVTTTSGTGSHVSQVAVVTETDERCKSAIYNSFIFPKVSIVDPELMLTVPKHVTASTGFDVFAHAFESYINPGGSPYTDLLALESLRIVAAYLPMAVGNGRNLEARTWMAWADTLAGLSIANAGVTLPHGIGMAMSGLYPHVAHGEALAAVYPAVMRYSWQSAPGKFAVVARIFDPSLISSPDKRAAQKSCDVIGAFNREIGMGISLKKLKIPEKEIRTLAEASLVLPDYKNHPRVATLDEVCELLKRSFR